MLVDWGPICFIVTLVPLTWMMDTKGLRPAVLCAFLFIFIGCVIRCVTVKVPAATYTMNLG